MGDLAQTSDGQTESASARLCKLSATALATIMSVAAILFALDVPRKVGLALFTEQYLALILGLGLALAFLVRPSFGGRARVLDLVLAGLALAGAGYVMIRYPVLVNELVYKPVDGLLVSLTLGLLTIEAVRRVTGWALTGIVLAFALYGLFGHLLPFGMSRPILWDRLAIYVVMDTNGMLGLPLMVAAVVVFGFILMGNLLAVSGGSTFFNDLALALVGRARGGAAKIAVVSSFLFGSVSGSAVANVVASGVVTLPLMRRAGYDPKTAASIEALASTGGQLAPPIMGAAAFLMAEFLQIPYSTVVVAAILPSFLYYLAIFLYVDRDASVHRRELPPDIEVARARTVLARGWHYVTPFAILLGTMFWLNWRPELSALAAAGTLAVLAMVVPYRGERASLGKILAALPGTGRAMVEILVIAAGAGIVIGALNISGLAFSLTLTLAQLAEGSLLILLVVAALASIVLGMGMPTVGVYVLLASLIGPSLTKAGIDPVAAHLFLLYFGMLSMITPPVALASFTAASMAGAPPMQTGLRAVRIGWVAYLIPFVIVIEPGLVMRAPPMEIAWNLAAAIFGIYLATAGLYGHLRRPLSGLERLLFLATALVAILPIHAWLGIPLLANAVALAAGAALLWWIARTPLPAAADGVRTAPSQDPMP